MNLFELGKAARANRVALDNLNDLDDQLRLNGTAPLVYQTPKRDGWGTVNGQRTFGGPESGKDIRWVFGRRQLEQLKEYAARSATERAVVKGASILAEYREIDGRRFLVWRLCGGQLHSDTFIVRATSIPTALAGCSLADGGRILRRQEIPTAEEREAGGVDIRWYIGEAAIDRLLDCAKSSLTGRCVLMKGGIRARSWRDAAGPFQSWTPIGDGRGPIPENDPRTLFKSF